METSSPGSRDHTSSSPVGPLVDFRKQEVHPPPTPPSRHSKSLSSRNLLGLSIHPLYKLEVGGQYSDSELVLRHFPFQSCWGGLASHVGTVERLPSLQGPQPTERQKELVIGLILFNIHVFLRSALSLPLRILSHLDLFNLSFLIGTFPLTFKQV